MEHRGHYLEDWRSAPTSSDDSFFVSDVVTVSRFKRMGIKWGTVSSGAALLSRNLASLETATIHQTPHSSRHRPAVSRHRSTGSTRVLMRGRKRVVKSVSTTSLGVASLRREAKTLPSTAFFALNSLRFGPTPRPTVSRCRPKCSPPAAATCHWCRRRPRRLPAHTSPGLNGVA